MKRRNAIAALCLLGALSSSGQGAELMVPANTGSMPIVMHVISLREAKFANIVEQKTDYSCGAAALATLLDYAFNRNVTEPEVILGMMQGADPEAIRTAGFSMLDMKRYVQTLGLRASGFVAPPEKLMQLKIPVIILLDSDGFKHFAILKAYSKDWVYLADPALGNRTIATETFKKQWSKVLLAVVGPGYRIDTPLKKTSPKLSARAAVNDVRPVVPADLLEYGFLHSDFF